MIARETTVTKVDFINHERATAETPSLVGHAARVHEFMDLSWLG